MRRRSKVKLSVGASAARKIMATGCALPTAFIAGMILWLLGGLMYETVAEGPFDLWGELVPHIVVGIVFLPGVWQLHRELVEMGDIFEQVKSHVTDLIQGSVSREEAADWAMERVKDESADYSSHSILWTALDRLAGADLQQGPGLYLHGEADFRSWLADLDW